MRCHVLICVSLFSLIPPARPAGAAAKWWELTSENFVVITDTSEPKGRRLIEDLENRVAAFSLAFREVPERQFPIEVFLLDSAVDFEGATPLGIERVEKSAYLYRGPDRIFITARDKSPEDLARDYGHALGHVLFERIVMWRPFWLSEAAAEYVRRLGRDPENEEIDPEDRYSTEDLLTIVRSATYIDDAKQDPFRLQAYRLYRVLRGDHRDSLQQFLNALSREDGSETRLEVATLDEKLRSYSETRVNFPRVPMEIRVRPIDAEAASIRRGDLLVAAGRGREADRLYAGQTAEARIGLALLAKVTRPLNEARVTLERASREFKDSGLVQFHYGAIEARNDRERAARIEALERAVELLPRMGRAHAALAQAYTAAGQAEKALKHVRQAMDLEPEFADRFYEILAETHAALGNAGQAYEAILFADKLPHRDREAGEYFTRRVASIRREIENRRRELERKRLEALRTDVEKEVERREPLAPRPPPPPPAPPGRISYTMEGRFSSGVRPPEVLSPLYPDYPEALRRAGTSGQIRFEIAVDAAGKIGDVRITSSTIPELNDAALQSVEGWTFTAAQRAGRPVSVQLSLTLVFSLQ